LLLDGDMSSKKEKTKLWEQIALQAGNMETGKQLLGFEGSATKQFFQQYFAEMKWYRRLPRAKVDPTNVLMDIGYTMLFNFVDALTGLYGFDSYKGVYHTLYFQRKSLICDLVEPFRCIIDKQIVKSFHLHQIDLKDFKKQKDTYMLPYDKQRKYVTIFSQAIMDRKEDMFCFVRDYYYCVMNDTEDYPIFSIH